MLHMCSVLHNCVGDTPMSPIPQEPALLNVRTLDDNSGRDVLIGLGETKLENRDPSKRRWVNRQ